MAKLTKIQVQTIRIMEAYDDAKKARNSLELWEQWYAMYRDLPDNILFTISAHSRGDFVPHYSNNY